MISANICIRNCALPFTPLVSAAKRSPSDLRRRRHKTARNKINGTNERPRLCVYRSNNHIYAQVIDDIKMHTVAATGTLSPQLEEKPENNNISAARIVGKNIAEL